MGRGKSQRSLELIGAAQVILAEIQPATIRAVCYKLFTLGEIESMSKNCTNRVSTQLVYARENGLIPWNWIVDETREVEGVSTWADPEEYMETCRHSYRRDYWIHQSNHVEVWSEKGTVRGTLAPVMKESGVDFRVMHGYTSATEAMNVAWKSRNSDQPFVALYIGDWDPSGLHMSEVDLPRRIEEYGGDVEIIRVALTQEDVDEGNMPSFPAKPTDTRYRWFRQQYGSQAWELDAMSPPTLRDRMEREILSYIDQETWLRCMNAEAAEQASLKTVLDAWVNGGRPRNSNGEPL